MKKRIFSMLLVFAMVFSMLPTYTFAADISYGQGEADKAVEETGVTALKTVTDNGDGTYTITLSVQGYTNETSEQRDLPADIVLVVDTSTSMDYAVTEKECDGTLIQSGRRTVCDTCGRSPSGWDWTTSVGDPCELTVTLTNRLDVAKAAATQFATGLLAKDGVAMGLYDFSGSNRTNIALTSNKDTILQGINGLSMPGWGDGTDYTLGLEGAEDILENSTKEQRFVVFISDGEPNGGNGTTVATRLRNDGVTIFAVGIDIGNSTTAQNALKNVASSDDEGNKLYFEASTSGDSSTALSAVLAKIQEIIEATINAGENAVMKDVVSDDFQVTADQTLPEGLTNENGTLTWNIGSITSEEKTVTFVIEPKEPLAAGTYNTNESVTLTFDDPAGNKITYTTPVIGDPTITIGGITITGASKTVTYNGEEQSVADYAVEGLPSADYTVELTYGASGTDAGTYNGVFGNDLVIYDENGKDVTYRYAAALVPGALTISQKAITIQAADASKIYDGSALTADSYTVSGDLAAGDEITSVTVTGSQTVVGSSANVPSAAVIMDGSENVTANYSINYVNGTLTVAKDEGATIEVEGYTGVYDGEDHDGITKIIIKDGKGNVLDNDDWTITYTYNNEITDTIPQFKDAGEYVGIQVTATNPNYKKLVVSANATISKKNVTITSPSDEKVYDGTPLSNEDFTVEGFVDGEGVTFRDYASITYVGIKTNTISYDADKNTNLDNYSITKTEGTLTITPVTEEIVITADNNTKVYDGSPLTDDGFTVSGKLVDGDRVEATVHGEITDVGTVDNVVTRWAIMRGDVDVSENYNNVKTVDGVLTVTKRAATLTSGNAVKEYDGTALTAETIKQDGFVDGEGVEAYNFASITEVGSAQNTFEYEAVKGTNLNNYTITVEYGTLQITASDEAVLTVNGYNGVYDGNEYTVTYSIAGDVEGTEWTYKYSVDGENYVDTLPHFTDVGEYTVYVKASNANYVTKTGSASVVITPRAVTLTSDSASRPYNGTALKAENVTVSGQGFVEGEGAVYSGFASITYVGSVDNEFGYDLTAGTKAANYTIDVVYGTLEITEYTENLTITADSNSKTYDGQPLSDNGYTVNVEKLDTGDIITAVVEGTITNVGTADNVVVSVTITNSEGMDVTDNYNNIDTVDGTLTVNPASATITSLDAEKMYDGEPLVKEEVAATGFIGEDASLIEYFFTGSQTYVGESDNTFEYVMEKESAQNYEIEIAYGTLKVTPYTGAIQIIADSDTKMYDGTPLTDDGYTYTGDLVRGDSIEAVVEGSITNVGVADNVITEYAIMRGEEDVTRNYADVTPVNGVLKVTTRTVNLTSATDSKLYDGTPLTNDEITVTGDGFVEGEGAEYTVTGEQTDAGSSKNTFSYELNKNTIAENYVINTTEGTLTVFPVEGVVVTITENSGVYDYDGSEYTVEGYEITAISDPLYTEDDFIFEGSAAVSATEPGVYSMELTPDMFTNLNGNFENVTFVIVDGTMTINPQVTVEYYLMDDKGNLTAIDYDDGDQENPFTVPYGEGWTVAVGETEEEADYYAPKSIEYKRETYNFKAVQSSALSSESTKNNVTVELVYEIEEDDFIFPIIEDGSIEITKELTAPEGFTGSTVFTFEIFRLSGSRQVRVGTVEVGAGEKEEIKLYMGRYLIKEVGAERDGYDLDVLCSDEDRIVRVNPGKCSYVTFENVYTPALNLEMDDHFAYIIGYPDDTVRPSENITRAEAATIFFRLLTDETRAAYWSQENSYSDVNAEDWFNNAISTLSNAGVLNGYADGTFRPNETITRAELVKMAVTFYSSEAVLENPAFTDVAGHWAEAYIAEAVNLAFINGYTDGSFKPDQAITRAEAMKIINRTLNRAPHADHLLSDMIVWADNMDANAWYYAEVQEATNSHSYEWIDVYTEEWIEILPVRNWAALEQSWSDAYAG